MKLFSVFVRIDLKLLLFCLCLVFLLLCFWCWVWLMLLCYLVCVVVWWMFLDVCFEWDDRVVARDLGCWRVWGCRLSVVGWLWCGLECLNWICWYFLFLLVWWMMKCRWRIVWNVCAWDWGWSRRRWSGWWRFLKVLMLWCGWIICIWWSMWWKIFVC